MSINKITYTIIYHAIDSLDRLSKNMKGDLDNNCEDCLRARIAKMYGKLAFLEKMLDE